MDLAAFEDKAVLRCGVAGESYVFNPTGQEIELAGLLCICRGDASNSTPLGNPVKDSMEGKLSEETTGVVGVIYAPEPFVPIARLQTFAAEFGELLRIYGHAADVEVRLESSK